MSEPVAVAAGLPPEGSRRVWLIATKTLVWLGSFAALGWEVYGTNNELQLPLVQHANDPTLFPGDPFVATLHGYASLLWQVLWLPFRFLPEAPSS